MSAEAWAFLGSVIVGLFSLLGVIYSSKRASDTTLAKMEEQSKIADERLNAKLEKSQAVTDEKLQNLADEVKKHNGLIERTYHLESQVGLLDEKINSANKRIADLEHIRVS